MVIIVFIHQEILEQLFQIHLIKFVQSDIDEMELTKYHVYRKINIKIKLENQHEKIDLQDIFLVMANQLVFENRELKDKIFIVQVMDLAKKFHVLMD